MTGTALGGVRPQRQVDLPAVGGDQVREEAARLSMATTDDPYDPAFTTAQAVLVTSHPKLLNGKSAFGVVGGGEEPVGLGVVDDAHAALVRTEDQFRLRVPASHGAYGKLLELSRTTCVTRGHVGDLTRAPPKRPVVTSPDDVSGLRRRCVVRDR
ncbi:hypothetical protein AB0G32_13645 [Streptomyces sp. NPDC023723]|uniref:hypothetical protein n=1 Tax=Streptomyces sp. NPDC023723 TaxID=3154323 RepID=UPI0034059431